MKRTLLFVVLLTIQSLYCMEEMQTESTNLKELLNIFQVLPDPIKDEILTRVPFLERLHICRRVCKEWKNKIDTHYTGELNKQQDLLDLNFQVDIDSELYNQLNDTEKNLYKAKSSGQYNETDVIDWKKTKYQKMIAAKCNLYIWLHSQLQKELHEDLAKKTTLIEQRFGYAFTINPLWSAVTHNAVDSFELLLAAGEDVNEVNVLEDAIRLGRTVMAKKLIQAGAAIAYQRSLNFLGKPSCEKYNGIKHAQHLHNTELVTFIKECQKNPTLINPKKRKQPSLVETEELPEDF